MKVLLTFVVLSLFSCNIQVKDKELQNVSKTDTVHTTQQKERHNKDYGLNPHPNIKDYFTLDTINSQVINEKAFILIYPTDQQLKEAKELNETDFFLWKEDNDYWMSELQKIAAQLEIKTIIVTKRKLHFISKNQTNTVDLDKKENGQLFDYNLILFNPDKTPAFTEFVQPDKTFFKEYFDLKDNTSSEY